MRRYGSDESHVDWIYECAVVADGGRPQRELTRPKLAVLDVRCARLLLERARGVGMEAAEKCAVAVARMGVFTEELISPLSGFIQREGHGFARREEALLFLTQCDPRLSSCALLEILRGPDVDDWLSARAMFALIALGDREILTQELERGDRAAGGYCDEFAIALMGLADSRGAETIHWWTSHPDRTIRRACQSAVVVAATWERAPGSEIGVPSAEAALNLSTSQRVIAEKSVCVLLVRGTQPGGEPIFAYVAVRADRLPEFMTAQTRGVFYPEDYGMVLESGEGDPSPEIRERMTLEYGFNHEDMEDIADEEAARQVAFGIVRRLRRSS